MYIKKLMKVNMYYLLNNYGFLRLYQVAIICYIIGVV